MAYDLVIKGGTVYTASDTFVGDIGIKDEKIVALRKDLDVVGAKVIDAKGLQVIPGCIDVHVHFQLPSCGTVSADDFHTGTKAAACGGVTTIIDFADQTVQDNLMAGVESRIREAESKVVIDYSLHANVTSFKKIKSPVKEFKRLLDFGIPSYKMFMIYEREGRQSADDDIFGGMLAAREVGATICVHAESAKVMNFLIAHYLARKEKVGAYGHALSRPNFIEEEAIHRAIKWAEVTGAHLYVVHLSTGGGAQIFKEAHARGLNVHVETCPQYLVLNDEVFKNKKIGYLYATCPQVKKKEDNKRLWQGLSDGEIAVVSTDTCTFTAKQKAKWNGNFTRIPYGLPGVETLLPVVYSFGYKIGRFSLNHLVALLSTNPAKIMGLYPKKGTIAVGSDADLAVISPRDNRKVDYKELVTNCDWSPYQGMKMYGFPKWTISRGEVIVSNGRFDEKVGRKGRGKFIKRKAYGWRNLARPWYVPDHKSRVKENLLIK